MAKEEDSHLSRAGGERADYGLQRTHEIEVNFPEFHSASFDLREVGDVVLTCKRFGAKSCHSFMYRRCVASRSVSSRSAGVLIWCLILARNRRLQPGPCIT